MLAPLYMCIIIRHCYFLYVRMIVIKWLKPRWNYHAFLNSIHMPRSYSCWKSLNFIYKIIWLLLYYNYKLFMAVWILWRRFWRFLPSSQQLPVRLQYPMLIAFLPTRLYLVLKQTRLLGGSYSCRSGSYSTRSWPLFSCFFASRSFTPTCQS